MTSTQSDYSDNNSTHSLTLTDSLNGDLLNNNQPPNTDSANLKYDKLIQDYVKLRSKLTILKKAYVELSEQSGQKDKSLRKYEQELESLNFRNQQLTGRVDTLQKELDSLKNSSTTTTGSIVSSLKTSRTMSSLSNNHLVNNSPSDTSTNVLEEELMSKITENATLHKRIHEIEINYQEALDKQGIMLENAQADRSTLNEKLSSLQTSSKGQIEKLQNDKIKLEHLLSQRDNEINALNAKIKNFNLKSSTETTTIAENTDSDNEHNLLPANSYASSFVKCLESQMDSLSKIYTSLGERNEILQQSDSSQLLSKCERLLTQVLIPAFKHFDGNSHINDLKKSVTEFGELNKQVLKTALPVEHSNGAKNEEVQALNRRLKTQLSQLMNTCLENEENAWALEQLKEFELSSNSNNQGNQKRSLFKLILQLIEKLGSSSALAPDFEQELMESVKLVQASVERILRILNEKLSVEYGLSYPVELTMVDECIVSYLTQFKETIGQVVSLAVDSGLGLGGLVNGVVNGKLENSKAKAQKLEQAEQENKLKLASEKLVKMQKDLDDSDRLRFQLEQMATQLVHLQTVEKEQKAQILKLETEKLKAVELSPVVKEESDTDRLETIKNRHHERQLEKLRAQNRMLDSKAVFYYEEMKCMLERLELQIKENGALEADSNEIKDQLERTRSSYEMQMSTMSDHLIEVTDRMRRQEEENEKLHHDLMNAQALVQNGKNSKATKRTK